ncbi:hypothetical protein V5799_022798 [Amblyomma americanum]|uniref:Uncharacterized protein n=1 Tax=Amblyomma americanum TaxID=6943 RepID=A0AAQ4FL37_AMBAM
MSSAVPHWMPKEIQHYFLSYQHEGGGSAPGLSSVKPATSALQCAGGNRSLPHDDVVVAWTRFERQQHCTLCTLRFVAVFASPSTQRNRRLCRLRRVLATLLL